MRKGWKNKYRYGELVSVDFGQPEWDDYEIENFKNHLSVLCN